MNRPIWLYDGVCVLCSTAVRYVLKYERKAEILFVAMQSERGRSLAREFGIDPDAPETFLFIEHGKSHGKSDGVIALASHVSGPARILRMGKAIPRPIRDWLYDRIARNRYNLFGRRDVCMRPDEKMKERFVLPL
jgi:predicted DCC family thiol-disulfide oxidoreductase YuxK